MYHLEHSGMVRKRYRLVSHEMLGPPDFANIAVSVGRRPLTARKIGLVAARKALMAEAVETRWNGKETSGVAEAGDWIVTSLTPRGEVMRDGEGCVNTYVIRDQTFARLYQRIRGHNDFGDLYRSMNIVKAIRLEDGFDILAPWGERQVAPSGYLILNGDEVYGNNRDTFETAYEIVG